MTSIKYDINCPFCKHKNRVKINDSFSSDKIKDIISGKAFKHTCKKCGKTFVTEHPCKIEGEDFIVFFTPTKSDDIKYEEKSIMRVCDTYQDLIEKLLIINNSLNDIVIEFLKKYVYDNLDLKLKKDTHEVRFNGLSNDKLEFALLDSNTLVGINKSMHDELIKKMRFKKIKKCVLIDKNTYNKYYKWRLFKI